MFLTIPDTDIRRAAFVIAIAALWLGGCNADSRPPAPKSPSEDSPAEKWHYATKTITGSAITFVPLPPTAGRDRNAAEDLSRELFTNISADPESLKLLSRLYGGLPVELVSLDGGTEFDATEVEAARPNGEGPAVLLSLHLETPGKERSYGSDVAQALGYDWAYSSTLSIGRVVRQESGANPSFSMDELTSHQIDARDDREILSIVGNEYLLRHAPGWQLMIQAGDLPTRKPYATEGDLREALQQQIDSLSAMSKTSKRRAPANSGRK